MADEATNSTAEEIAGQAAEGSVESLALEADTSPDVVPVRDLMALKDKNEKTKAQLKAERERVKELEAQLAKKADDPDDDTLAKFPDVDPDFIKGLTEKAKREAIKEMESKLAERDQRQTFEKRLDQTVAQQLEVARQNGVKIPNNVDTTILKQLALANPKKTVAELAESLWWIDEVGKATTENDARPAMDYISEKVDIRNIPQHKKEEILKDSKARQAYFDALDKAGR